MVLVVEMMILLLRMGRGLLLVVRVLLLLFILLVDGYRGVVVIERVLRRHPS